MTVETIKQILCHGGGIILVLMTIVQVSPIKINPWTWLARVIGRAINGEVLEKVNTISDNVKTNKDSADEEWAELRRTHILRFGDEIRLGHSHSEEHFNQVLYDIHKYELYCNTHKDYENDKAIATINLIKNSYAKCLEKNNFL